MVGDLAAGSIRRPLIGGLNSDRYTLDATVTGVGAAILQLNTLQWQLLNHLGMRTFTDRLMVITRPTMKNKFGL